MHGADVELREGVLPDEALRDVQLPACSFRDQLGISSGSHPGSVRRSTNEWSTLPATQVMRWCRWCERFNGAGRPQRSWTCLSEAPLHLIDDRRNVSR